MNSSSGENNKWGFPLPGEILLFSAQREGMTDYPVNILCNTVLFLLPSYLKHKNIAPLAPVK